MEYIINEKDIVKNISAVRNEIGDECRIIGVLKGNGYGFGTEYMAKLLKENGVEMFAVTEIEDAQMLKSGILKNNDVLVLRSTAVPDEIARIVECGAIATVGSVDSAMALNAYSQAKSVECRAHIKVDSGMGRYGFLCDEMDEICHVYESNSFIRFEGIYTHFAAAFTNISRTEEQLDLFLSVVNELKNRGYDVGMVHAANSSAAFNVPASRLDCVRIGSAFTGRILGKNANKLTRVGTMEVKVVDTSLLPKGYKVGYNGTFTTKKPTKIAILPIGHANGWGMAPEFDVFSFKDAVLSGLMGIKSYLQKNRKSVMIGNKRCYTLGQIGLSHTAVDITGTNTEPGDVAQIDMSPLYVERDVPRKYIK